MPNKDRNRNKICHCTETCNRLLGFRQRRRHYRLVADPSNLPRSTTPSDDEQLRLDYAPDENDIEMLAADESDGSQGLDAIGDLPEIQSEIDSSDDEGIDEDAGREKGDDDGAEDGEWEYDAENDVQEAGLSLQEMREDLEDEMGPGMEIEMYNLRNHIISAQDRINARAFKLRQMSNMPRRTFNQMRYTFGDHLEINSEWVMLHRFAILTEIEPIMYDCCINSCVCYTGKYENDSHCRFCQQPRMRNGKPVRSFSYLPLIPRLQGYFQSKRKIEALSYRSKFLHTPGEIHDVFDSDHYQNLLTTQVVIDGHLQNYSYFDSPWDIAFSFCADGYLLFKRRRGGPSATPLVLQLYNLSPTTRTHSDNLVCMGVIPGPSAPKDLSSFLAPFDEECAQLAYGVVTFNAATMVRFILRAYRLGTLGDMVSINSELGIKGHNGFSPCRSCNIKGVRNVTDGKTIYYVPLAQPSATGVRDISWDPADLPMRTHESFGEALAAIKAAPNKKASADLAMYHGINKQPTLHRVSSVDLARCYPWDWMHLLLENVVPALVKLWMGKYKGLDVGSGNYEIEEDVWEIIGQETADAVREIPASFVRSLPNIATARSDYTAEAWCFWIMHLAPILLQNRFADAKYHQHLCDLVEIMRICLQFEISAAEIDDLENKIHSWVFKYEEYYYQYQENRLEVCTTTIHGLLHIPDNIRYFGPVWTSWTFHMERVCGDFQRNLRSKTSPWSNLNKRALHMAYLEQLRSRFDLEDELAEVGVRPAGQLTRGEKAYDEYENYVLRTPYKKIHRGDDNLRRMIADYFKEIVQGGNRNTIRARLPENMPLWGKVRIAHGGDSIRSKMASSKKRSGRNMSFVRFELVVFGAPKVLYGRLEKIIECQLPDDPFLGVFSGELRLLAHITPCKTEGKDATRELTFYREETAPIITDLATIKAVVGRARTSKTENTRHWGIIDRSSKSARPTFEEEDGNESDDDEDIDY